MEQGAQPQQPAFKASWFFRHKVFTVSSIVVLFPFMVLLFNHSSGQNSTTTHSPSPNIVANATNTSVPTEAQIKPEVTKEPIATAAPTETPEPLTLEEKIVKVLPDSISNPDVSVDDAIDFNTDADVPGKKDVTITANHNGMYLDTNSTKEATWKEAVVIMQRVFPLDDTINGIIIMNEVPITDAAC